MKSVSIFYSEHDDKVTQHFSVMLSSSFQRHGYNVIPMCTTANDFEINCRRLSNSAELEFCIAITPQSINITVDGIPIWKHLSVPFFIYVLDTPIYHLNTKIMKDLLTDKSNKIFFGYPDANQMNLMNDACRQQGLLHKSLFVPFASPKNPNKINYWKDRDIEVSIFGNVGKEISAHNLEKSIEETFEKYENTGIPIKQWTDCVHAYIESDVPMNVTNALLMSCNEKNNKIFNEVWCAAISDADSFIKRHRRIQIVKSIQGKKIHTFGVGWDCYDHIIPNMTHHGATPYPQQFDIFNRTKLSLNIDPNWDFGVHDRVFNAASMGAVSLTQHNLYIDSYMPNLEASICYSPDGRGISDAINVSNYLIEDIAKEGTYRTSMFHTWDNRVLDIILYMSKRK